MSAEAVLARWRRSRAASFLGLVSGNPRSIPTNTMSALAAPPVVPGQILAGKYRIVAVLGMGGMGVVVSATHLTLREQVAIKFLLPAALVYEDTVERFLREARSMVRLKSEHVVRVADVGTLENGSPYMVMERLE